VKEWVDFMDLNKIIEYIIKPDILIWIIIILVLLISRYIFGIDYISTKDIVINHFRCFKSKKGKWLIVPLINYAGIPLLLAYAVLRLRIIDDSTINIITIIISIITAMLFTLLTVVIDMKAKIKGNPKYYSNEAHISNNALIETYYTIMFEILVSVLVLIFCLFNVFTKAFTAIQSFVIYFLTFTLIINLLMIIKRIFKIIDLDMKK